MNRTPVTSRMNNFQEEPPVDAKKCSSLGQIYAGCYLPFISLGLSAEVLVPEFNLTG